MFTGLMIDDLYEPDLAIGFIWTVALTVFLFLSSLDKSVVDSKKIIRVALFFLAWLLLQLLLSANNFYLNFSGLPPRVLFAVGPPVIFIIYIIVRKKEWLAFFSLKRVTQIHVVRVFVEVILLGLYFDKQVPRAMTFEGINFDILAGITAPVMAIVCFTKQGIRKKLLLGWNIVCLLLLINIVCVAFFSAPTIFQKLNFSQPNIAIGYFPFIWLPAFVVPVVLFSHIAAIHMLMSKRID